MNYVSTRGAAPVLSFDDVLLAGLARDGGLYVPETWPEFTTAEIAAWKGLSYTDLALKVMTPFVGDALSQGELAAIINEAYSHFETDSVAPLVDMNDGSQGGEYLLELFHGPTLAFKDVAMQFLGPLFDHVLAKKGARICIAGATSGDTGSAAIEAVRDRNNVDAFILYPHGRVSDVQRRQMTTVDAANIHTIALEGTFDDCQDAVKALFNDLDFRDKHHLSAVNSINWARVMAQVVYYFWAALKVGGPEKSVAFAVPTGNFGNVFAGYVARRMGLPISQFVVGSNSNDILTRFFNSGAMEITGVHPTISPSMDIQVSSNFERLLFELFERDGARVADTLTHFRESGHFNVAPDILAEATALFDAARFDDDETRALIGELHGKTGMLLDPHSAVGLAAARKLRRDNDVPMIVLATAHPAKFPDAVEQASGVHPALPPHLADLMQRDERINVLANDLDALRAFIEMRVSA
ncbi:MAG: threonine synthase [Rhodospirillaceae bacterium]|nr:threonine synthase [Rhodospirillaceae bacterium]